ncbi:hypothetical protein KCV04_g16535, partial [Aureobasidium melanogenum]
MSPFYDATTVTSTGTHTYTANFSKDYCIGSVPHGGYVTSCFMRVAQLHFATTLAKQNQPHTMSMHLEFLRRTSIGPAQFNVRDVKIGRGTSIIHVTLFQDGGDREEVAAYITNSNLATEKGTSFPTGWKLEPAAPPADVSALKAGTDDAWKEQKSMPFAIFRRASQHVNFYFPRQGQRMRSLADQWMCFSNGERFTNSSLGYVSDMFPQILESYRTGSDPYAVEPLRDAEEINKLAAQQKGFSSAWYPTLLLNLDVKKLLPEEGVEFLFLRVRAKQIKNGRYDLEVIIMDDAGDIVALSHHICMIMSSERNLQARSKSAKPANKL